LTAPTGTLIAYLALLAWASGSLQVGAVAPEAPADTTPPPYPDHTRLLVVRDARGNERPVKTAADWEIRRGHILAHLQEVMGPLPGKERRVAVDVRVTETHRGRGYTRQKISFASEPGDRVPAWLLVPDGGNGDAKRRRPAMLCLHQTIAIGKDEPAGLGTNPDLDYARELAEQGYVTIAPDYPNFGEYPRDVYAMGYASASMKAIWNNIRAIDVLTERPDVDPERIGVIGHSLGGHNAIFTALFEPRIKAIVSSCGFNAFPDYFRGDIAGWSHNGYMPRLRTQYALDLHKVPFDFPELIGALAPRAFFTNSPLHDTNFAVEGVRVCLAAARPVYALLGEPGHLQAIFPDAGHSFPLSSRDGAFAFLDRSLSSRH
jgi:pimeloyl-ACP methyl ester carboxylesterase